MNFENPQLAVREVPEAEKFQERLSTDYQSIRKEAQEKLTQKILLMEDELGANNPEIAKYKMAKEKLADKKNDQWIINFAKANNWENSKAKAEDLEEEDKKLVEGLVNGVLNLH